MEAEFLVQKLYSAKKVIAGERFESIGMYHSFPSPLAKTTLCDLLQNAECNRQLKCSFNDHFCSNLYGKSSYFSFERAFWGMDFRSHNVVLAN